MVSLSIYLVSRQHMSIHWVKESSSSLVDAHESVRLFDASLRTLGNLVCHDKGKKTFGSLHFWFTTTYDSIRFIVVHNLKEKAENFSIINFWPDIIEVM